MKKHIIAISVDKVQTFLYYVIRAHVQEKQSNSGTLQSIIGASNLISSDFYQDIENEFAECIDKPPLLKCSGTYIFSTNLTKQEATDKLKKIFNIYYKNFSGQLLLKYLFFTKNISSNADKLQAIHESKDALKKKNCLNDIIKANRSELFRFLRGENIKASETEKYSMFAADIDELYLDGSKTSDRVSRMDNPNHFRVAVIKADFDGMGALFKGIDDYAVYKKVSEILNEFVCINNLGTRVEEKQKTQSDFKVYPLYMAGDDIFFAVPISQITMGVDICRDILCDINEKIENELKAMEKETFQPLVLSIGIDFTFNREPIRYYYERVEKQLECAKAAESSYHKEDEKKKNYVKICLNDQVFYDYDRDEKKKEDKNGDKYYWTHFIHSVKVVKKFVKLLNEEKGESFAGHHFFYGLLNKITNTQICRDEVKYSNAVLYHLLPQYLGHPKKELREFELWIIEDLLKRVSYKNKNKIDLKFDIKQRKNLEHYVQLLLLFADPRFEFMINIDTKKDFKSEDIKTNVFNRTLRYIYENQTNVQPLRSIFIQRKQYDPDTEEKANTKKNHNKDPYVYRTLRIANSMFHRIKRRQIKNMEIIAKILELVDDRDKITIQALEQAREAAHRPPPNLFFNRGAFLKAAKTKAWNEDYIDSLLIFYQWNQLLIHYKSLYPSDKKSTKGGNKK